MVLSTPIPLARTLGSRPLGRHGYIKMAQDIVQDDPIVEAQEAVTLVEETVAAKSPGVLSDGDRFDNRVRVGGGGDRG